MKEIPRDALLNQLIERRENGMIKVITGIRRCGKSYLLFKLYEDYLRSTGVPDHRILRIALDDEQHEELLIPKALGATIRRLMTEPEIYYVFLDEIQFVPNFEKVLNGLNRIPNIDLYVTGSNSKFLSSDILTEFRGRGDEVRVSPLTFSEYAPAYEGNQQDAWNDYVTYGGLPLILSRNSDRLKSQYLSELFKFVYLADIVERNKLRYPEMMDTLVNILASSVGSLTNPYKLARTFASSGLREATDKTISAYLNHLVDAFLIQRAERFDIKGKRHIASPYKYYFTDVGLRNVRVNFRQQEENHLMENILYNELIVRGYNVDVGIVEASEYEENGKRVLKQYEVDFVCNQGNRRYYIQSAFSIPDEAKMSQEKNPLVRIKDSFKKIIVVRDPIKLWRNEDGIVIMGIQEFLLDPNSLDL